MNGSGLRENDAFAVTSQQYHADLKTYYQSASFEQINSIDGIYDWLETHLHDRLFLGAGKRTPNWPIGAARMIQYRVKVNKTCFVDQNDPNLTCHDIYTAKSDLMDCLTHMHSIHCNPMFTQTISELGYPQEFDHLSDMDKVYVDDALFKVFEPLDSTKCATESCSEYQYNQGTLTRKWSGKHGSYPDRGYFIDFTDNYILNTEKIAALKAENWIDQDTRGVQMLWTIKSAWSQTYYTFQASLELPGNGLISQKIFSQQNLFFYNNSNIDRVEVIFHTLILLHCILYLIKILFELQLGISRVTNFLELLNLGAMFVVCITKYVEIVLKNSHQIDMANTDDFQSFQLFVSIEEVNSISLALCSFFFPFRIFQFMAHFEILSIVKTVINTLCRTAPGLFVYGICCVIMVLCWAQGLYIMLSPLYPEFDTYQRTIFSILVSDFQLIGMYHDIMGNYSHGGVMLNYSMLFIVIMKSLLCLFAIALMTNLYKKAMSFEKGHISEDPEKLAFYNQVDEIQQQVEEIHKITNSSNLQSDVEFKNQKIIAWLLNRNKEVQSSERQVFFQKLNQELQQEHTFYQTYTGGNATSQSRTRTNDHDDLSPFGAPNLDHNEIKLIEGSVDMEGSPMYSVQQQPKGGDKKASPSAAGKGIHLQPIEFENVYWLEQFLLSLFQLKPALQTVSYDKFRIVIEFFSAGMGEKRFDISIVEQVIDNLRQVGCKVPVLIYSDIKLNKSMYQRVMQLKKKYLMLFYTNEIKEVRKFCKMEHIREKHGAAAQTQ